MDRERLTITLKKSVLKQVDDVIDGSHIRNRSHAIEYLLTQSLSPKVSQAVILAGGPGLKMRPFTYEMPKSLFPVSGKPILEHALELLRKHDIRDIIIVVSHLGDKIRDHLGSGRKYGLKITYVKEEKPMGTGGALRMTQKLIDSETFVVLHGDVLIDINLYDLVAFHKDQDAVATLALTSVVDPSIYGSVKLHGVKIVDFIEKPKRGSMTSQLINSGIYVFEPDIFKYIPSQGSYLLEDIFPKLAREKKLAGFSFEGKWFDIGTPASYERAIKSWQS
ncbi:nucleotidyltransferase family protein [Candidatus Gottesmanbacteria bacterium]|nr:nucleotidyltransferase family protein [Candidatus Gottesmanbacteria bacterium]